jgi:nucleotide-binding universal stress UspA family protein
MDTSTQGAVVVGVTAPGRETAALRFAAEVARREGADVVLVHAASLAASPPPPLALLPRAEVLDVAGWVVKEVGEEFAELTGGAVEFRTVVVSDPPARALVGLGQGARYIVVQHRRTTLLASLVVASTANGAAAHASCPVISVPEDWEPVDAAGGVVGEVVVGVHEGGVPRQALEAAFAWAAATGAPLRVAHGWRLDPAYDDIIDARVAAEWHESQVEQLTAAVHELREQHPAVPIEIEVRHQSPTQVLVDDSQVASLVVVGRHAHGWAGQHLGSVARTVLREASSPVMVVPVERHRTDDVDWGLVADEVSPQT